MKKKKVGNRTYLLIVAIVAVAAICLMVFQVGVNVTGKPTQEPPYVDEHLYPFCGNGICDNDEDYNSCPQDCHQPPHEPGSPPGYCGDGTCKPEEGEECDWCPQDCGNCCGNGVCDYDENCRTCPKDCGEQETVDKLRELFTMDDLETNAMNDLFEQREEPQSDPNFCLGMWEGAPCEVNGMQGKCVLDRGWGQSTQKLICQINKDALNKLAEQRAGDFGYSSGRAQNPNGLKLSLTFSAPPKVGRTFDDFTSVDLGDGWEVRASLEGLGVRIDFSKQW